MPLQDSRKSRKLTRVAAFDCGTNSIRLLIADVTSTGQVTDLVREMTITRLGQGVDRTGVLDPVAIERTVLAAGRYQQLVDQHSVQRTRFVTTSASRDASNRDMFVSAIREVTGIEPEVLTGTEEAELSFRGAISSLPTHLREPRLVVDIGGGSTEFVVGGSAVQKAISIDMGSVRVTERFGGEPWTAERLEAARYWIGARVDEAAEQLNLGDDGANVGTLVGVAGTVTSMAAFIAGVSQYSPEETHGLLATRAQWTSAIEFMIHADVDEKDSLGFMPPGRADVIAGGALVWEAILKRLSRPEVVASEHDILDGIAISLA